MITDEQIKLLTEWMGEEEHHEIYDEYFEPRTFDNWDDFGAVVEELGVGLLQLVNLLPLGDNKRIPERFCILVAEAIKEGVIK